jgi:NADH-ubiquinone oxidoreductase chain 4L
MNITLILFLIGILGFVLNRKNIILMLISIEIMLLSITFLILLSSLNMDDIIGQTYAIYIIVVAGAESAIGLGILVAFYRLINFPVKNPRSNYSYSRFNLLPATSPSNLIQLRNYSSETSGAAEAAEGGWRPTSGRKIVLSPSFISGFSDAEGSFVVTILKNPRYKIG